MRMTRCEACGAKALMAASQCPKCGEYLGLRDDNGELLAMARCPSCESYYPRRRGGCKWCGTKPPPSVTPKVAMGALGFAAVVLVVLGGGSVVVGGSDAGVTDGTVIASATGADSQSAPRAAERAKSESARGDRAGDERAKSERAKSERAKSERAKSERATTGTAKGGSTKGEIATRPSTTRDEAALRGVPVEVATSERTTSRSGTTPGVAPAPRPQAPDRSTPAGSLQTPPPVPERPVVSTEPPRGVSDAEARPPVNTLMVVSTEAPAASRAAVEDAADTVARLIARPDSLMPREGDSGTARTWVNVRAGTGRDAEVVGVLTPDTPVRFGERRGAWIRVSTAALSGWADRRLFAVNR